MKIESIVSYSIIKLILAAQQNMLLLSTPIPTDITTEPDCGVCDKALSPPSPIAGTCRCYPPFYWNGDECVNKARCPCMVGHIR